MTGESDDKDRAIAKWHLDRAKSDLQELEAKRIPLGTLVVAALPPIPVALSGISAETIWPIWAAALVTSIALAVLTMRSNLSRPKEEQRDHLRKFIRDLESIIASDSLNDAQRDTVKQAADTLKKLRGW